MRRNRTMTARGGAKQDFWLSFSDLMSVLVLVFILILFYILYKYFIINAAYQKKFDEMLVLENTLSAKEVELNDAQAALSIKEEELTTAQDELARQQLMLNLAQEALDESETELSGKQEELDAALILLGEREAAVAALEDEVASKQAQIDEQQLQLEALVGVRSRIIKTLSGSLASNNISATVDPSNGSIIIESDVMFEYGSDELSYVGKAFIDKFLPVYLSVLFSDDNSDYISEVIIEGHTDTEGSYISNLRLSQERAYAVAEYALSDESHALSASQKTLLRNNLTCNGRSYSDPIYNGFGMVDADASRRVVFKFRLTDEQMIAQMQAILDNN